jgi:tetratricopeptide (TPR) repeat protein
MTRIVTTAAMILLLTLFVGCQTDTGTSQKLPMRSSQPVQVGDPNKAVTATSGDEIDLVEKMTANRQAYERSLQALIQYYDGSGNHEKQNWAKEELTAFNRIPQYRYIFEMPTSLKAKDSIPAADQLYNEAEKLYRDAGVIPLTVTKDVQLLQAAMRKYEDLISRYPTSDKIDDAAYRMGTITEGLGDTTIALACYQRAYQWDPATPYPARFKAANILDKKLHRRAEALEVYQEAIAKETKYTDLRLMAERRVQELNTSKDSPK